MACDLAYPSGLRGTGGVIRRPCAALLGVIFGPRRSASGPDTRQTYRMTEFAADSAVDVFFLAIGMALLATLLWMAYKTLQHPRLPVNRPASSPPSVTWSGVLRYLLTTPLMVAFWMFVLLALLTAAARDRSGEQIVVATSAVIGGARLLAHVHEEIAHELAKAVPIAILGFILIGGGFTGIDAATTTIEQIPVDLVDTYWFGLVMFDFVITALWFGSIRLAWRRRNSRVEGGGSVDNWAVRALRRLRRIGYTAPAGEAPPVETV